MHSREEWDVFSFPTFNTLTTKTLAVGNCPPLQVSSQWGWGQQRIRVTQTQLWAVSTEHYRRGRTTGASHTQYYNFSNTNNIIILNDISEGPRVSLEIDSTSLKNENTEPTWKMVFILFSMEKRGVEFSHVNPTQVKYDGPLFIINLGHAAGFFHGRNSNSLNKERVELPTLGRNHLEYFIRGRRQVDLKHTMFFRWLFPLRRSTI